MIQVATEKVVADRLPSDYLVRLDNFEGPLDLLLHLIKQDEMEIWEISISRIAQQYVAYLELMEALDIEIASEFLVMAATLMRIKSQRLLPRPVVPGEDDDEPLTEEEFIQRLLTYKAFKEVAASFRKRREEAGPRYARGFYPGLPDDYSYPLQEVGLYTLLKALSGMERRAPVAEAIHEVHLEEVRLEDRITLVLARLEESRGRLRFAQLFDSEGRSMEIAVTLLAILELAHQQVLQLMQDQTFGEIWIISSECPEAVAS